MCELESEREREDVFFAFSSFFLDFFSHTRMRVTALVQETNGTGK